MVRAGDLVLVQGAILNKQDESFIPCSCDAFMIKHRLEPFRSQSISPDNNLARTHSDMRTTQGKQAADYQHTQATGKCENSRKRPLLTTPSSHYLCYAYNL